MKMRHRSLLAEIENAIATRTGRTRHELRTDTSVGGEFARVRARFAYRKSLAVQTRTR